MSTEHEINLAKRLKDRLEVIVDLMARTPKENFLHKHLVRERDQVKADLMEMVKRADAANDEEFLGALGVKELEEAL